MRGFADGAGTVVLALLMLTGALGCGEGPESPEAHLPSHVRVSIIDATTGVGKADGKQWDGLGAVPVELLGEVAGALARRNPYVEIGRVIGPLAVGLFEKPDPTGSAEVLNGEHPVSRVALKSNREDTLNPQWLDAQGRAPTLARVPLNAGTRIRVQLFDNDDPLPGDPMGVCELGYRDLVDALQAQQVVHVNVAEQTNQQILFVGISVIPE